MLEILNMMESESQTCWYQRANCILLEKQLENKVTALRAEHCSQLYFSLFLTSVTAFAKTTPFLR